jgi:protein-S-isoprenylcysteine O-methyltransferase Ste14
LSTRIYPPVWFVLAVIAMIVLARFLPIVSWHVAALRWGGIALIVAGFGVGLTAAMVFRRRATPLKPFTPSTALVVDGPYRFTRNPMYLGLATTLVGVALALEALTPFIVVPVFVAIITMQFIVPEDAMLTDRFGDDYGDFRRRVRRWL